LKSRLDPRTTPGAWGEFLRLRGDLRARQTRTTEAYHDIAQSSSVFELVGERYQAASASWRWHAWPRRPAPSRRPIATTNTRQQVFQALGATRDLEQVQAAMAAAAAAGTGEYVGSPADADDALVATPGGCRGLAGPARASNSRRRCSKPSTRTWPRSSPNCRAATFG
jgi:hypothetical protein